MPFVTLNEVKQKYKKRKALFDKWVKIDRTDIGKEMSKNSSQMHYVGCRKSEAEFSLRRAEYLVKRAESRAFKRIKKKQKACSVIKFELGCEKGENNPKYLNEYNSQGSPHVFQKKKCNEK